MVFEIFRQRCGKGSQPRVTDAEHENLRASYERLIKEQRARALFSYPQAVLDVLYEISGATVERAVKLYEANPRARARSRSYVPFLPVIPTSWYHPHLQMRHWVRRHGLASSSPYQYYGGNDTVDTPDRPYYIFDVETGHETQGMTPEAAALAIAQMPGRRALTASEAVALVIHNERLLDHRSIYALLSSGFGGVTSIEIEHNDREKERQDMQNVSGFKGYRPLITMRYRHDALAWAGAPHCLV